MSYCLIVSWIRISFSLKSTSSITWISMSALFLLLCFTYPFPLCWCLSLKWVSVDYRNMGMLINPFSYHLIISFNWRIINSYTYYWKLCVYWTHYCFCLCYFYIFISWTRKVRKEVMNDGKGALRKEWQYTGDKMGEIRKEWGL